MVVSKTIDHIKVKINIPNPSQEPPASSKVPNEDLKNMGVLCTFKIKIESQHLDHGFIKDHWPNLNQDQDGKPQSGTSSTLQSPKWGLRGHWCSLHLQNQDREPKFRIWMYQRPVTIFKSKSRFQTQSGTSSILQSLKLGLKRHMCSLHLQNQDRVPTFWSWLYPKPLNISKSRSWCQTPVRNLQRPKSGLRGRGYSLNLEN